MTRPADYDTLYRTLPVERIQRLPNHRDRRTLELRKRGFTRTEVARTLGLSSERIRQVERLGLKRLGALRLPDLTASDLAWGRSWRVQEIGLGVKRCPRQEE